MATYGTTRRRGLPRVAGGAPWPPPGEAPASVGAAPPVVERADPPAVERAERDETTSAEQTAAPGVAVAVAVRRGLPRVPGGESWPPADFVAAPLEVDRAPSVQPRQVEVVRIQETGADVVPEPVPAPAPAAQTARAAETEPMPVPAPAVEPEPAQQAGPREPLPFPRAVFPGAAAAGWNRDRGAGVPVAAPEPRRYGPFTRGRWAGAVVVGGLGLLFAAGMLLLAVRWFLSLSFMQDFVGTYPGEYHLPVEAPVGFPAWVGWQHFFNVFLMVLIIRSGLQVRRQQKPPATWSPRWNPARKISINLWLHQSLDILWLVNGVIFVVLLFVTGQWLRIVPSSWEVFPNAITAALKYVSLNWPTEDGWVNYNSLQQLAYFATVFLAAPLAALTGVRMSGVWPKDAKGLNTAYPVEWARAVHFPVMIYFVLFIIVHVALVFATGALRNLNHMYGRSDVVNWVGFWIFIASMVVIAAGWIAARPLVLAPIARLFGKVSGR